MGSSRFVNSNSRIIKDQSRIINEESSTGLNLGDRAAQKELREGWGMYRCADGQSYIGNWHQGKMDGHGKLYYNENKLRYEGDFKADKFHGQGREYSDSQNRVREEEIDENFVRLSIGSWLKYEGRFKEDVK